MILEFDGLDKRWEEGVNWDLLNPQGDNLDDGFDLEDIDHAVHDIGDQERQILNRVAQWEGAVEVQYEGNEVVEDKDDGFDEKRSILLKHFHTAYNKGLVSWPRGFTAEKKKCYKKGK
jgi:hypothetical protein